MAHLRYFLSIRPNLATLQTIPSVGIASSAVFLDSDNVLLLNAPTDAMVSINQSTKEITSIFPTGLTPASAPVADPQRSVLYSGGYEFNDGTTNVISTTVNRIVDNLPAYSGFAPVLATATQLYGDYNGEPITYSFAQKSTTALPYPLPVNPNYYTFASPGTGPPNGRSYWVPFQILPNIVDDGAGASFPSGIAVYNTATNALVGRMLFDFPPGRWPSAGFRNSVRCETRAYLRDRRADFANDHHVSLCKSGSTD